MAVDDELALLLGGTTQGGVEHGAVLGGVDVHAGEHGVATLFHPARASKIGEELDRLIGDQVLGQVKVQVTGLERKLTNALGVRGEPVLQADALGLELVVVSLKRLPSGGLRGVDRSRNGHVLPPRWSYARIVLS